MSANCILHQYGRDWVSVEKEPMSTGGTTVGQCAPVVYPIGTDGTTSAGTGTQPTPSMVPEVGGTGCTSGNVLGKALAAEELPPELRMAGDSSPVNARGKVDSSAHLQDPSLPLWLHQWSVDNVCQWLATTPLPADVQRTLRDNCINGPVLESLTEMDLIAMGLTKFGWRRQLLLSRQQLFQQLEARRRPPDWVEGFGSVDTPVDTPRGLRHPCPAPGPLSTASTEPMHRPGARPPLPQQPQQPPVVVGPSLPRRPEQVFVRPPQPAQPPPQSLTMRVARSQSPRAPPPAPLLAMCPGASLPASLYRARSPAAAAASVPLLPRVTVYPVPVTAPAPGMMQPARSIAGVPATPCPARAPLFGGAAGPRLQLSPTPVVPGPRARSEVRATMPAGVRTASPTGVRGVSPPAFRRAASPLPLTARSHTAACPVTSPPVPAWLSWQAVSSMRPPLVAGPGRAGAHCGSTVSLQQPAPALPRQQATAAAPRESTEPARPPPREAASPRRGGREGTDPLRPTQCSDEVMAATNRQTL